MATLETSDFRKGLKILYNNQPHVIIEFQHVKPGKGNQFTRTKLRNLSTGGVVEQTFRSGERVEDPEVEERTMTFLYNDAEGYHFMDSKTYEQVALQEDVLGTQKDFLLPEMPCDIILWKGRALNVDIPSQVELVITYCEPGVKGDTATNVTKPATVETGATVNVPLFINTGDKIKVDTASGSYLERVAIGSGS
ncbi:MAG: elongation factor P [Myxococcota bacterium]